MARRLCGGISGGIAVAIYGDGSHSRVESGGSIRLLFRDTSNSIAVAVNDDGIRVRVEYSGSAHLQFGNLSGGIVFVVVKVIDGGGSTFNQL